MSLGGRSEEETHSLNAAGSLMRYGRDADNDDETAANACDDGGDYSQ